MTIREACEPEFVVRRANDIWFIPKSIAKLQPPISTGWPFLPKPFPVMWWFYNGKTKGKLRLILEVGALPDPKMRRRLLEAAKRAQFEFREGGLDPHQRYTRIFKKSQELPRDQESGATDDVQAIKTVSDSLWNNSRVQAAKIAEVLKSFQWTA